MKIFRFALNTWITIVSVGSFLLGWVVLAHAPKPVSHTGPQVTISSAAPLPTLAPLQFGDGNNGFQNFQFSNNNNSNNSFFNSAPQPQPLFRTGGS